MAGSNLLKTLSRLSLGLVLVLVWAWMYIRADQLFPVNTDAWRTIIQTYMLLTAFIFSWDTAVSRKTERPIFEVGFLKAFPTFLISAVITIGILFLFLQVYTPKSLPSIYEAIAGVGLGVILLHAFFVAILEEKIFRGWVANQLKSSGLTRNKVWIGQAIIFAFFHYLLGRELLTIAIYIPLGLIFMYVKEKWSPKTDMANSGVHFAWNVFILGFLTAI
jgi:membrane protease YdiL (CAAX protease family)